MRHWISATLAVRLADCCIELVVDFCCGFVVQFVVERIHDKSKLILSEPYISCLESCRCDSRETTDTNTQRQSRSERGRKGQTETDRFAVQRMLRSQRENGRRFYACVLAVASLASAASVAFVAYFFCSLR